MQCGGPVAFLAQPATVEEVQESLRVAREMALLLRMLGGGSNLILAEAGFRGVLLQPSLASIEQVEVLPHLPIHHSTGRYQARGEGFLKLEGHQDDLDGTPVAVRMGAGVPWGQAVAWTLHRNLAGLHKYARIPCRVGGAIYNNIHAAQHLLSEHVAEVEAVNMEGQVHRYGPAELEFGYDHSRFHRHSEVIVAVTFGLHEVGAEEGAVNRALYQQWTAEKGKVQPSGANCGSVFQNLTPEQAAVCGETALAAAWYIDQCDLKGESEGGMQVYPGHANFIVNRGDGTQADFIRLVQRVREKVADRWGFWLQPEAECMTEQGEVVAWPATSLSV